MHRSTILLVALLLAPLVAACGGEPPAPPYSSPSPTLGAASCGPLRHPPVQSGGHLLPGHQPPVPYSSTPPTSGWHASGFPEAGVHGPEDRLDEPEQVTLLELGAVVVTWNGLTEQDRAALEEFVAEHAEQVASTPYDGLEPGRSAMAAWGALRLCEGVDLGALAAFTTRHAGGERRH